MKGNYLTGILASVLCMGLAVAGCSGQEETEEVEEKEEIQEIGDPASSLEVDLTDELGSTINGLSVKEPEKAAYPSSLMAEGQQIENTETVKFYYDPEIIAETAADTAMQPDQSVAGYWNCAGDTDLEMTIWEVQDHVVTFRLWWRDLTATRDLMASFDSGNSASFAGVVGESSSISGTMTFSETTVTVIIDQCDFKDLDLGDGTFVFDEKHAVSWEDEEQTEEAAEEEDAVGEEVKEETEDAVPYLLQVTLSDSAVYEITGFTMADMAEATLCQEDDLAWLEYTSLSTGEAVSTKEQEQTIKADREQAQPVIDKITLIGTVTLESEAEIDEAREAYDALTEAQKEYVTNEVSLRWKEKTLASLISEKEAAAEETEKADEDDDEEYTEGDNWAIGYNQGVIGKSESEASAYWNSINDAESRSYKYYSQYEQDYWDGYYAGYAVYEEEKQIEEADLARAKEYEKRGDRFDEDGNDLWEGQDFWDDDEAMDWD